MGKGCAFTESTGTLEDLKKAAELFLENGILCRLLSAYEWEIGSKFVSRSAPLLQPKSKWYLENCRLYLSGQAIRGTKNAFIALAAVEEEGRISFAVVAEQSGEDDPTNFAAVDAGNLCGGVFGIDYGFSFSSTELSGGGGITVGATIFKITILVLVVVLAGLLVLLIIVGTMERFKRNRAARIKYAPPKEKSGREERRWIGEGHRRRGKKRGRKGFKRIKRKTKGQTGAPSDGRQSAGGLRFQVVSGRSMSRNRKSKDRLKVAIPRSRRISECR